jgi:hypothetical protein
MEGFEERWRGHFKGAKAYYKYARHKALPHTCSNLHLAKGLCCSALFFRHYHQNTSTMGMTSEYDGPRYFGLSGTSLSRMIGFAAGSGFLLFGYDQGEPGKRVADSEGEAESRYAFPLGVMGALLTLPSFVEVFPQINTSRNAEASSGTSRESTLQGVAIGLYESACDKRYMTCIELTAVT